MAFFFLGHSASLADAIGEKIDYKIVFYQYEVDPHEEVPVYQKLICYLSAVGLSGFAKDTSLSSYRFGGSRTLLPRA